MAPLALALNLALQLALGSTEPSLQPVASQAASSDDDAARAVDLAAAPDGAPRGFRLVPPPVARPSLAPRRLDPGPFRARELLGATVGAFTGDALVLGSGYLALRMFASGTISPTATNFRRAVYGVGAAALIVPPVTAVLLARLAGGPGAPGGVWKAILLATAGQLAALVAGYYAAPRFWVVLPVQAVALSVGASLGLHLGARAGDARLDAEPAAHRDRAEHAPGTASLVAVPVCADS
jgi:hypothetical protein